MNDQVKTALTTPSMQQQPSFQLPTPPTASSLILDVENINAVMKFAQFMASGRSTIPNHLQGNPADCAAVVTQAMMWRMNPFAVAQKTHIVNGTLGYEGQLVNAAITASGVTQDRLNYEWFGDWEKIIGKTRVVDVPAKGKYGDKDYKKAHQYRAPDYDMTAEKGLGIRVWATIKGESEPRVLELLMEQASVRNSPLWATDPKQQLGYLAAKRWARLHTPDVILGVYTPDELEEFSPRAMKDINEPMTESDRAPRNAKPADVAGRKNQQSGPSPKLLEKARAAADGGRKVFAAFWKETSPADRGSLRNEVDDLANRCDEADRLASEKVINPVAEPVIDPQAAADFTAGLGADDYVPE